MFILIGFLTPAQYEALVSSATGQLIGIGMELEPVPPYEDKSKLPLGTTIVARTEDGSPAEEAGLQRGDIILNVDGTVADRLSPEEVASLSRQAYQFICKVNAYIFELLLNIAYFISKYEFIMLYLEVRKEPRQVSRLVEMA